MNMVQVFSFSFYHLFQVSKIKIKNKWTIGSSSYVKYGMEQKERDKIFGFIHIDHVLSILI